MEMLLKASRLPRELNFVPPRSVVGGSRFQTTYEELKSTRTSRGIDKDDALPDYLEELKTFKIFDWNSKKFLELPDFLEELKLLPLAF
jgi:hypothetical protein